MNWDFAVWSLIYFRTASMLFDLENLNLSKYLECLTGRINCLPVERACLFAQGRYTS